MGMALVVAALWIAFAATHMGASSRRLRPRLVGALGQSRFLLAYSILSFAIFIPLVWVYLEHRHAGPLLWYWGSLRGMPMVVYVGMGIAFALIAAGAVRGSPAAAVPGKAEVRGVLRVTRHPVFMGLGLVGLLHLFAVAIYASDLAFFAGFPLFALIGCAHQDLRKRATGGDEVRGFIQSTAFLPFTQPAGAWRALVEDALPILVGVGAAAGIRWLHPLLFR